MRVAVVMTGNGAGGLQQVAVPYAVALARQGHDVLLVASSRSPMLAEAKRHAVPVAQIHWPRRPWPVSVLHVGAVRRALRDFAPDAIIGIASKGYPQARAAFGHRVPILSHCGGTREKVVKALLEADHLIVTSAEMAGIAQGLGMPAERMSVIPNFLIGPPLPPPRRPDRPVVFGSLGRFAHRKGFDLMIEAARILKTRGLDVQMVIGGTGEEANRLRRQAAGLPVRFAGWIGNAAKTEFLHGLDIFVCPSRFEPFGNVYLEAMQHGLPVVTAETTGSRTIFPGGDGAVVVPPDDAVALADALEALAADPVRRKALGQGGQVRYADHYSLEAAGPRLAAAVERAVLQFSSGGLSNPAPRA